MVMNFAVFDTNLHMINHYKRINSAKSIVNTSAPRCYQSRFKHKSNLNSRYSTPTLLSTSDRIPSRANSNCEFRRKCCNVKIAAAERSSSVPPRPGTRRNCSTVPQNFIKSTNPCPKINDSYNTKKIPIKPVIPKDLSISSPKHTKTLKFDKNTKSHLLKPPVPTPRNSLAAPKLVVVPEYEYLQFSLRITEDIIRNDLYSQKEMRRVFNSHIEANRGRLNMKKMLQQIEHLCNELNISKKVYANQTHLCSCNNKTTINTSENMLKKILNGKYVMSDEEIHKLTENDLQDLITAILNGNTAICPACEKANEPSVPQNNQSNNSPSFDLILSNVENFVSISEENMKICSSIWYKDTKSSEIEQETKEYDFEDVNSEDTEAKVYIPLVSEDTKNATLSIKEYDSSLQNILTNLLTQQTVQSFKTEDSASSVVSSDVHLPKEIETVEPEHKHSEEQYRLLDFCSLDPICSKQLSKQSESVEPKQKPSEEQNRVLDFCSLDPICSKQLSKQSESVEPKQKPSEEQNRVLDFCLLDPICSKQLSKQSETVELKQKSLEEQSNLLDLCSLDPICSKQLSKQSETVKPEQKPLENPKRILDFRSLHPIYFKQLPNQREPIESEPVEINSKQLPEQTEIVEPEQKHSDVQITLEKQKKELSSCSQPQIEQNRNEETKDIEVSIVEDKPVDSGKTSEKNILVENRITQTSFTVEYDTVMSKPLFYFDSCSSGSRDEQITTVYERDSNEKVEETLEKKKEKDEFISSITKFILDKTFSKPRTSSNNSVKTEKKQEVQRKNGDKNEFVSTVEKLINDRTKDLYKYSVSDKNKSSSKALFPFSVSVDNLDKYETEYSKEYSNKIKRKTSISSKASDLTLSEGEVSKTSSNLSFPKKFIQKINRKSQSGILEHLKKYEQSNSNKNFLKNPCLCDYELKIFEDQHYENYVPKFRRSLFFPAVSTQTSNTEFKSGFNESLLSDGEVQNTETETDVSDII